MGGQSSPYIYREGKSVVDSLAKQALKFWQGSVQLWRTPSEDTSMLLHHDSLRCTMARRVTDCQIVLIVKKKEDKNLLHL